MKLTTQQVEYVSNYIQSFDIKWYELQVELTDHMVNSMEGIWTNNPKLTFEEAKAEAINAFGSLGFKGIEKERIVKFREENKKEQNKMVLEFLGFPQIIGSLALVFVAYRASYFIEKPSQYIFYLNLFLLFCSLFCLFLWIKNRTISGKRFLVINKFDFSVSFALVQIGMSVAIGFKDEINQNNLLALPLCILWVIGILFLITQIHIFKKTIRKIKKQYQLS